MSLVSLSVPQVEINNENVRIVPNSLVYDAGEGEINVRSASGGGFNSETVASVNAETFIGKVMFDMYLLAGLDNQIRTWKTNIAGNTIKITQRAIGSATAETKTFPGMSLVNMVERNAGADTVVSLEFSGDPMVAQ